jgi:glycerol-3-phosphate dehydrogenase
MADRAAMLRSLQSGELFDLLVIGGGATGCGVALDAASRGLKVALAEKGDFGSGTSGKSTKLVHGGVRYLERALLDFDRVQFNLVRDALHERTTLLRIAPHLCHTLPLVIPLYSYLHYPYYLVGLKIYDLVAGGRRLAGSRLLCRSEVLARFPLLRGEGLKGGVLFSDGQFNDARMNLALALTALQHGAALANYLEVLDLVRDGEQVAGARVQDRLSGEAWTIRARCVINACGPCCDAIRRLDDPDCAPLLRPSLGIHLALVPGLAPSKTGLLIPKTEDGRVLFVLPWLGGCLVGTTDRPASSCQQAEVTEEDVDYLRRHLERYFGGLPEQEIAAAWAGVRPLVADPTRADTARLARDHVINRSRSGLVTIAGGKWTTYRKMAQDTVDFAVGSSGLNQLNGCRTDGITLHGGEGFRPEGAAALAAEFGLGPVSAAHLHGNYGDRAADVAKLCQSEYREALAPGHPYLRGEVLYAVREELAVTAADFLLRRIPLGLLDSPAVKGAAAAVVELMGQELEWDEERSRRELREVGEVAERRIL